MDHQANSQAERDLSWVVNSPSLISPSDNHGFATEISCREFQDRTAGLEAHLAENSVQRVGRYFEQLVHYYLESICEFEIVAHGRQIRDGGRTLGEIDFLFRNTEGELCHLEAAVKFYLHCPDSNARGSHFIGPNASDNFEKKMRRLFDHQLPISKRWFPEVSRRLPFVKGRIFYHPLDDFPQCLPDRLSSAHLRGTWIRESELRLLNAQNGATMYKVLRKPLWLAAEVASPEDATLQTICQLTQSIQKHFNLKRTPQLVSRLIESDNGWHEVDRVFIVADEWPAALV